MNRAAMPICHLHIGLHKAASSTLQHTILVNQAQFAAHGIYVPQTRTEGYSRPHHQLAWEFHNKRSGIVPRGSFAELKAELNRRDRPGQIIITSEDFETSLRVDGNFERLRAIFADMGYRLRIIAYVRPQVGYINSRYAQLTKIFGNLRNVEDFVTTALADVRFDYAATLAPVLRLQGIETVVRPFSRDVLAGGIAHDFLATLGLSAEATARMTFPPAKNVIPGPRTVAACLAIGRGLRAQGAKLERSARKKASKLVRGLAKLHDWNDTRFSGVSADQAQRLRDRFAASNDALASAAWNRSWSDVYGEDSYTPPPLNVFERDLASPQDRHDFDAFVEAAWQAIGAVENAADQAR